MTRDIASREVLNFSGAPARVVFNSSAFKNWMVDGMDVKDTRSFPRRHVALASILAQQEGHWLDRWRSPTLLLRCYLWQISVSVAMISLCQAWPGSWLDVLELGVRTSVREDNDFVALPQHQPSRKPASQRYSVPASQVSGKRYFLAPPTWWQQHCSMRPSTKCSFDHCEKGSIGLRAEQC